VTFYGLHTGDVTADVQLGYFQPINKLNKYFVDRSKAFSAAQIDAVTAVVRQTVQY